ncbi:hypothetical protein ALC62_03899 [Cyphomyrmex costatus]|uniref:Uncharacterized protein n=1 Tax=Cyphomyrmex costatus TaxID=456900 RepID=A0A151IKT7_9HYME|nr:hypothetical protein ALC62_03899 [Cyphomyrmex costatus]
MTIDVFDTLARFYQTVPFCVSVLLNYYIQVGALLSSLTFNIKQASSSLTSATLRTDRHLSTRLQNFSVDVFPRVTESKDGKIQKEGGASCIDGGGNKIC